MIEPLYKTYATATGGRHGRVSIEDGQLELEVSLPKQLGGPGGDGTNPEQLFGAAYAACFAGSMQLVAGQQKLTPGDITVTARVALGKGEQGLGLLVELIGQASSLTPEQTRALMTHAHAVCPYSQALRNNVQVDLRTA